MVRPVPALIPGGQGEARGGEKFTVGDREWEVFERLPFGKNLCRSGGRTGYWSDKEIRAAQAKAEQRERGRLV